MVEVEGRQPIMPYTGERVAIVVTVRAGDRSVLPGAEVTVSAGGGDFLTETGAPIDPQNRGSHPNSVQGTTDSRGQFTAYWMQKSGRGSFVLGIRATKKDYIGGRTELSIRVQRR